MVSKNWDKREREIEKHGRDVVTLKRDQDDMSDLIESRNKPKDDLLFWTLFMSSKHRRSVTAFKNTREQILDLLEENSDLLEENSDLRRENSDLRRENSDLRGYRRMQVDDMREQSDASREELQRLFAAELADASTDSIDGLLKDYIDPEQDSQELVRSVRDN